MRFLAMASACAALLAAVGCGQATSACDQVAQKQGAVIGSYCAGKDEACWFCKCLNQDRQVKVAKDGATVVFSCVEAAAPTPSACDGSALEAAQACLKNEPSCIDDAATLEATSKCGATKP